MFEVRLDNAPRFTDTLESLDKLLDAKIWSSEKFGLSVAKAPKVHE